MTGSANVVEHLSALAAEEPDRLALISPEGTRTFRELEEQSTCCARGLLQLGITRGTRTVLMVRPGIEFLILTFALIKAGAVLILVDPGMGWRNLGKCLGEAQAGAFIGISAAHLARILFGWAGETVRSCVSVGSIPIPGTTSFRQVLHLGSRQEEVAFEPAAAHEVAAIVFTSGSTGVPKGVVYRHGMFVAQANLLRDHFNIEPGEIDLATFPLFALYDPVLKMTTVFPKMDFTRPARVDPTEILNCIRKYQVTHMFGSPALLDRVGRFAEPQGTPLLSLKRVLSAGAPVSPRVLQRFSRLLGPGADVHTPYGATEALPVCSISSREVLKERESARGKGVCVGSPLEGIQVAVIQIRDEPIREWSEDLLVPNGEIGELVVWGPNVSREYFARPGANDLAKIATPGKEAAHRMGDVGYLDDQGRFWFCGRKSHRVITSQSTLFTVPCEGIFNEHPEVYRSALVGVGKPPRQEPVLCVELEDKKRWKGSEKLRDEILALGRSNPLTQQIKTLLFHPSFPVDVRHNAKIFREKLASWAGEKLP